MLIYLQIAGALFLLGYLLYRFLTINYKFWEDRNIPGPKPELFYGNAREIAAGRLAVGQQLKIFYEQYKHEPMVGIYLGRQPALVLHDTELIKTLLMKDFSNFGDRGIRLNEKMSPFSVNLFTLERERWKILRTKLSPIFTTGKIKEMCAMSVDCAAIWMKYIDVLIAKKEPIDVREMAARYTTDVIGTCAFGIDTKSMSIEENEFRKMGKRMFNPLSVRMMKRRIEQVWLPLAYLIEFFVKDNELYDFFINLTMSNMEYRKKNKVYRNDFVDTLIDLEAQGTIGNLKMTKEMLVAQSISFFAAGFETTSATITHGLYELALNQDIQDKLREEIKEYVENTSAGLVYEHIKDLKYLDKTLKEILRKYPSGTNLVRQAAESYTFEGTNITIPPKTHVFVPTYAFHYDPDIFPNPNKFDPERFDENVKHTWKSMQYLPFGDGPRNCIGARFAIYQTKVALFEAIRNFKVDVTDKTMIPYEMDPKALVLSPLREIYLSFTRIQAD